MPRVSCILNTFNRPQMLKEAVASVLCQTLQDWQLVIAVDHTKEAAHRWGGMCGDCFDDKVELLKAETVTTAQNEASGDKRIVLDYTELEPDDLSVNRFGHNINLAFKKCTGDFITYLCDDDLFTPWRLSVFSRVLDDNPDYQVVYGKQLVWDIPTDRGIEERPASQVLPIHPEGIHPFGRVNHNSIMHKRECFDAVGGWVENAPARLGDAYFFARLNQKYAFHPIDCVGEVMRMGEQNCWSGKPQSEAEKVNVGAFA